MYYDVETVRTDIGASEVALCHDATPIGGAKRATGAHEPCKGVEMAYACRAGKTIPFDMGTRSQRDDVLRP